MRKKIFSAFIMFIVFFPILLIGGNLFNVLVYFISFMGLHEFINIKESKKEIPFFISIISFVSLTFLIFSNINGNSLILTIDYRILAGIFLMFLLPTILYHDRSLYSVNDAFYMIGGVLFLGISFSIMIMVRNISVNLLIYLILIAVFSDIYAFVTGKLIGKNYLLKEVSPCKTIEGMIGGILFGTFVSVVYYNTIISSSFNLIFLILITFFLCVLGQLGDLCFSFIKRYFGKKDFSNIIPGHGGILDRFDSVIFILLGFMFFINIMGG